MVNSPKVGDVVRYSRSAARAYGLTSEQARNSKAMVTHVYSGYVTVFSEAGGDRNMPIWAIEVVSPVVAFA